MIQHSKRNEGNSVTNVSVTINYTSTPGVSTQISEEESEKMIKHLIKLENEYQEKLVLGKEIYEVMGEGIVSYQALPRDLKETVDLYIENQADLRDIGNVELKEW